MKNVKYLQRSAPDIIHVEEPSQGFGSIFPMSILSKIHTMNPQSDEIRSQPKLSEFLKTDRPPSPRILPDGLLFSGTIHFAQVTFDTPNGTYSVREADIETIINYTSRAITPIQRYTSQYGDSNVFISSDIIRYSIKLQSNTYNKLTIEEIVKGISDQNKLQSNSCVTIINPNGPVYSDEAEGNSGYHGYVAEDNLPYIFLNVFEQGITVQDPNDSFAMGLSHEIAEMIVDPNTDPYNPEVCDPCDLNCNVLYRHFFNSSDGYISTTEALPPGFDYGYYICGIASPGNVLVIMRHLYTHHFIE